MEATIAPRARALLHCLLTPWYDALLLNVQWAFKETPVTYLSTEAGFDSAFGFTRRQKLKSSTENG